jgi:hypothetical protein
MKTCKLNSKKYLGQPNPKCAVCLKPIQGTYIIDPWKQAAHVHHKGVRTLQCASCQRILSTKTSGGGFTYSDGRHICGLCKKSAIVSTIELQRSKNRALQMLKQEGLKGIPPAVPVKLANQGFLNQQLLHAGNTKGFTQSQKRFRNGKIVSQTHVIYILAGLPRVEFESVLAHELMHVWLNEHGIQMPAPLTEGFCNLGAALVCRTYNDDLGKFLLQNMKDNPNIIYGNGFRKMLGHLKRYGWKQLLKKIKARENLDAGLLKKLLGRP